MMINSPRSQIRGGRNHPCLHPSSSLCPSLSSSLAGVEHSPLRPTFTPAPTPTHQSTNQSINHTVHDGRSFPRSNDDDGHEPQRVDVGVEHQSELIAIHDGQDAFHVKGIQRYKDTESKDDTHKIEEEKRRPLNHSWAHAVTQSITLLSRHSFASATPRIHSLAVSVSYLDSNPKITPTHEKESSPSHPSA